MDVVIVLLVLGVIAIILVAKGKPIWNSWRSNYSDDDAQFFIAWAVIQLVCGALLWSPITTLFDHDDAWNIWGLSLILLLFCMMIFPKHGNR
jgi:prolipoprotein diacylglyceryltransferase